MAILAADTPSLNFANLAIKTCIFLVILNLLLVIFRGVKLKNVTATVFRGRNLVNIYTPGEKTRRVLTAAIAAAILVATTAAVGRIVTGG